MARRYLPRALAASLEAFVLAPAEIVYDETAKALRYGDGETPGGLSLVGLSGTSQTSLRLELADRALLQNVMDNLPGDGTDTVRIRWDTSARVSVGDDLFDFIKATIGYTSAQMIALLVAANSKG